MDYRENLRGECADIKSNLNPLHDTTSCTVYNRIGKNDSDNGSFQCLGRCTLDCLLLLGTLPAHMTTFCTTLSPYYVATLHT